MISTGIANTARVLSVPTATSSTESAFLNLTVIRCLLLRKFRWLMRLLWKREAMVTQCYKIGNIIGVKNLIFGKNVT